MVKVLEKACCDVVYNPDQTCCGQPAYNAGFWDDARPVAAKFLKDFEGTDYIVSPSASCAGFVKNCYGNLFDNSSYHNNVKGVSKRIFEFSQFLTDVLKIDNYDAVLHA
ncbi:MAG TPA: (Fe-S)-binding protein, partial [Chitinophagaceae bacterium]|nr:(Fe-S)-binding protein [Chitinophagaceae bacterium]